MTSLVPPKLQFIHYVTNLLGNWFEHSFPERDRKQFQQDVSQVHSWHVLSEQITGIHAFYQGVSNFLRLRQSRESPPQHIGKHFLMAAGYPGKR